MRVTASGIRHLSLVCIPTPDQDRAIDFYESLGFEKRTDVPFGGGYRWVEVYPPGTRTGLALIPPGPDPVGIRTGVILDTGDIDATHAELRALGVDVDPEVARPGAPAVVRLGAVEMAGPQPPMFWFRDPDGNELLVVQPG